MRLAISVFHSPYVYAGPDTIAWTKPCIYVLFLYTLSIWVVETYVIFKKEKMCITIN
jgi:hypothetical protein